MTQMPLAENERYDVTLIALMDVITTALIERAKPKTRRYNQLQALSARIKLVDETFVGYLPDDFQDEAEKVLGEIEKRIVELNERR